MYSCFFFSCCPSPLIFSGQFLSQLFYTYSDMSEPEFAKHCDYLFFFVRVSVKLWPFFFSLWFSHSPLTSFYLVKYWTKVLESSIVIVRVREGLSDIWAGLGKTSGSSGQEGGKGTTFTKAQRWGQRDAAWEPSQLRTQAVVRGGARDRRLGRG